MSASNDNQPQSAAAVPVEALQDEAEFDFALTDMIAGVVRHGPGEWSGDTLQLAAVASMVREKVKPLIAAQVRAEADAAWHALTESILDQSNLFAADHEDDPDAWQLRVELLTATAGPADIAAHDARVRAEERQRVAGLIRKNAATLDSFAREGSTAGLIAYLIDNVMAAGDAVPVTTPEPYDDVPTGFHVVEDGDGERLVRNPAQVFCGTEPGHPPHGTCGGYPPSPTAPNSPTCSKCGKPRSDDPESEEGMSGMCLRCLLGPLPSEMDSQP